jgi:hypothetical protein
VRTLTPWLARGEIQQTFARSATTALLPLAQTGTTDPSGTSFDLVQRIYEFEVHGLERVGAESAPLSACSFAYVLGTFFLASR